MKRSLIGVVLGVALVACGEEAGPTVVPIPPSSGPRAPVAEEPSPLIVAPHLRRTEHAGAREPARPLSTGGGGGGRDVDWNPRPPPPPSQREVNAFRDRLATGMARVDPTDDPCDQLRDAMRAGAEAHDPQTRPEVPSRAEMRARCRNLPEQYLRCLTPEYHEQHRDECMQELERMAARGRRRTEEARRTVEASRRAGGNADRRRGEPEDG